MKYALIVLAAVVITIVGWRLAFRNLRARGRHWFVGHLAGGGVGLVASLIFLILVLPDSEKSPSPSLLGAAPATGVEHRPPAPASDTAPSIASAVNLDTVATDIQPEASPASLDMSPDEYRERFNRLLDTLDLPFRAAFSVVEGSINNVARASLNDHLGLVAVVDKETGQLKSVTLLGSGDGTVESGANILIVAVATLAAATPNGSTKTVGPEVLELMKSFDEEADEPASRIVNGVKFSHMRTEEFGAFFSAEPA